MVDPVGVYLLHSSGPAGNMDFMPEKDRHCSMKSLAAIIYKLIRAFGTVMFGIILAAVLLYHPFCDYWLKNTSVLFPNIILALGAGILCAICFGLYRVWLKKHNISRTFGDRSFVLLLAGLTALFAGLVMLAVNLYKF